jgi:hypothetical protein
LFGFLPLRRIGGGLRPVLEPESHEANAKNANQLDKRGPGRIAALYFIESDSVIYPATSRRELRTIQTGRKTAGSQPLAKRRVRSFGEAAKAQGLPVVTGARSRRNNVFATGTARHTAGAFFCHAPKSALHALECHSQAPADCWERQATVAELLNAAPSLQIGFAALNHWCNSI